MHKKVEAFIREDIRKNLKSLTDEQREMFRKLHCNGGTLLSAYGVVDNIPADKLESAMDLVDRTVGKNRRTK